MLPGQRRNRGAEQGGSCAPADDITFLGPGVLSQEIGQSCGVPERRLLGPFDLNRYDLSIQLYDKINLGAILGPKVMECAVSSILKSLPDLDSNPLLEVSARVSPDYR